MWEDQWRRHAPTWKDGYAHVGKLKLKAGPGFGDLSHPTTRLVLGMLPSLVNGKNILDIGSGSGILTLAALQYAAKSAHGIDIDPEAIRHAEENATLNNLSATFSFAEKCPKKVDVILMNMIRTEQQQAWNSVPDFKNITIVTSGVLADDEERYLKMTKEWGWQHAATVGEKEWRAYKFFL